MRRCFPLPIQIKNKNETSSNFCPLPFPGGGKIKYLVTCSYLEIYNEKIFDLLDANCTGLQLREDMKKGVMVRNLQELPVENPDEACEVLKVGGRNRRVATTSMNRESSRSHAVFTVTVKSVEIKGDVTNVRESRLNLIDLAGSERQRDTNAEGKRLKEAGSINKSLSALGNVIKALVDIEQGKQRHVAYRDSKLTFLLRDSLGGNTKTFMIANISPAARAFGETLSTLQFAARAKMIKNKAKINEDVSGDVAALRTQIKQLKAQLASGGGGSMAVPAAIMAGDGNLDHMNKLIMGAMASRARAEQEKALLAQQLKATEEALKKKDNQCRSEKMIVKFRNKSLEMAEKKLEEGMSSTMLPTQSVCSSAMIDHNMCRELASVLRISWFNYSHLSRQGCQVYKMVMRTPDKHWRC